MTPKEDDSPLAADVDDGAISDLDGTLQRPIELKEDIAKTRHVVHCDSVEAPALKTIIIVAARAKECLSLGLVQIDELLLLRRRLDNLQWCLLDSGIDLLHHGHEEGWFLLGLGQIDPLLRLVAFSSPMACAPTIVHIRASSLAAIRAADTHGASPLKTQRFLCLQINHAPNTTNELKSFLCCSSYT
jgi:hypothetical protein